MFQITDFIYFNFSLGKIEKIQKSRYFEINRIFQSFAIFPRGTLVKMEKICKTSYRRKNIYRYHIFIYVFFNMRMGKQNEGERLLKMLHNIFNYIITRNFDH